MSDDEAPWRNKNRLRELYWDDELTLKEIGDRLGCSQNTVKKWMDKFGIDRRNRTEAMVELRKRAPPNFQTHLGREGWRNRHDDDTFFVSVHRLLAVAVYGFDAVTDMVVHHKNQIPWDNRPDNITLMTHAEHTRHHNQEKERTENGDFA